MSALILNTLILHLAAGASSPSLGFTSWSLQRLVVSQIGRPHLLTFCCYQPEDVLRLSYQRLSSRTITPLHEDSRVPTTAGDILRSLTYKNISRFLFAFIINAVVYVSHSRSCVCRGLWAAKNVLPSLPSPRR